MKALSRIALLLLCTASVSGQEAPPSLERDIATVERVRGLEFLEPVEFERISVDDLRSFLSNLLDQELGMSPENYILSLRALGVLAAEWIDPIGSLLDLYTGQVLAFYDPKTGRYYVIEDAVPEEPIPGFERMIHVHELTHALQDQRFDAGAMMDDAIDDWDRLTAIQAVLEGEATLVMMAGLADSTGFELSQLLDSMDLAVMMEASMAATELDAPPYFVSSLIFPYARGAALSAEIWKEGGWDAISELYLDETLTTAEIYHPELDLDPGPIEMASTEGAILDTRLGEFHWRFFLGDSAGAGWRNDRVVVSEIDGGALTRLATEWADESEAKEFEEALRARLPEAGLDGVVTRAGDRVIAVWSWRDSGTSVEADPAE